MNAITGLLIGAGVAGVGVLVIRKLTAPAPQAPKSDSCELARAAAEAAQPGSGAAAYAACQTAKGLLGAADALLSVIAGLNNKDQKHADEEKRRDALNKQLNGAVRLAMPGTPGGADTSTYIPTFNGKPAPGRSYDEQGRYIRRFGSSAKGTVAEFENGCQPFKDAPGWSKCAPGTQSMWASDIDAAFGYFGSYGTKGVWAAPAFVSLEALKEQSLKDGDKYVNQFNDGDQVLRPTTAPAFLTGSARLDNADPLTQGPFRGIDGRLWWLYKGRRIDCSEGHAPDVIINAAAGVVDHRTTSGPPRCVPLDSKPVWTSSGAPAQGGEGGGGTGTRTELGCNGTQAPAGFTWVEASGGVPGHWERLRAGQTVNNGPCDPNYRPPSVLLAGSLLAVAHGGLARMQ